VAGSPEDSHYVSTKFWDGNRWEEVSINDFDTTGFLSFEQCEEILAKNSPKIDKFGYSAEKFLEKANAVNETLHAYEIPVEERAKTMAALLLAIAKDSQIRTFKDAKNLVREINGNIDDILEEQGKKELAGVLHLDLPMTSKNHNKYRNALRDTLQILRNMNIRSAINSGEDALGQFYETFLKYANGAKEMGIVLTPRHITRFAAEALMVHAADRVYDPACGTGGFLVSAMDLVKSRAKDKSRYLSFKEEGLFGVEQKDSVYGLAVVNMIFRGDGKSNVYDGNCFDHDFWCRDGKTFFQRPDENKPDGAERPFTKVLMNPPFKIKSNLEPEFVDHALKQLSADGLLFAVLPAIVIAGKTHKTWRENLLKQHTLKAVIKFDTNLFYPVAEATYGLIIQAHTPHKNSGNVFWAELFDAQHRPRLSKLVRKDKAEDNLQTVKTELLRFMRDKPCIKDIPNQLNVSPIGSTADFSPESRLPRPSPTAHPNVAQRKADLDRAVRTATPDPPAQPVAEKLKVFPASDLFTQTTKKLLENIKNLEEGDVPVISATYQNNGIQGLYEVGDEHTLENHVTISKVHNTRPCEAFWHPYEFSAISTVIIAEPKDVLAGSEEAILYVCEAITRDNQAKYHYARPVQFDELEISLPAKPDGTPDISAMADIVKQQLADRRPQPN